MPRIGTRGSSTYGASIGKASVTGCCIKLRRLADIDVDVVRKPSDTG